MKKITTLCLFIALFGKLVAQTSCGITFEYDNAGNRTKRIFSDPVGKRCGSHEQPFLLQTYRRDTGEVLHDISAPIYVKGRHWGGFRIGYKTEV